MSFTSQFALVLLGVGIATAVVAGAVAWFETQRADTQQQLDSGAGAARLTESLVRMETATHSQQFACEVAALPATAKAITAGSAPLIAAEVKADAATAFGGQTLVFAGVQGQVLGQAPTTTVPGLAGVLAQARSGSPNCAAGTGGFFATSGSRQLLGVGAAPVSGGAEVVVLTPVDATVLRFAQQLVNSADSSSSNLLVISGRLAQPGRVAGIRYPAGSRLPGALREALPAGGGPGKATIGGIEYAVAEQPLRTAGGATVATLIVAEATGAIGPTVGQLALPLAEAVAGVLLVGMVIVFLLVEHFLNGPLRRLDIAVQRLGIDAYAAPVDIDGAEEITRLAANFDIMRKHLRRQLLLATGRTVIASTLTGNAPVEQALSQVLGSLANLLDADIALLLIRPQSQTPRSFLLSTGVPEPAPTWADLEGSQGIVATLVREPRFLVRSHLSSLERSSIEVQMGLRDCLAEPLRREERDLGVLIVGNKHQPYLEEDYTLCSAVADQIVVAVEKSTRLAASQREATTDAMTGLYNYRFLVGYLDQQVNVAERVSSPLSVLMLDLDHFKAVNDSYGHPGGDRVLRHFASLMLDTIRKSDLAARYGGEEFVVVMANTSRSDAEVVADKIRSAVEAMAVKLDDGSEVRLTVSIGGVTFPEGSRGARNLLDLADRALYAAKRNGRNCVEFLDLAATAGEPVSG
jgi:diguanylate cyclase (GGDEF)-like protein